MMCTWEARPSGRPGGKIHCKIHGSRSMQEAIWYTTGKPDDAGGAEQDPRTLGSRRRPGAKMCAYGKPDRAGGPVTNTRSDTWRPVHAGRHTQPSLLGTHGARESKPLSLNFGMAVPACAN